MPTDVNRVVITRNADGYISVGSSYPPLDGEDWERGNDIIDGRGNETWERIDALMLYLRRHPEKNADDWKRERFRQ